jgi:hypothetical protein
VTKTVTADEDTWNRYLERHPEAKPFRAQPFLYYEQMDELCAGAHATGVFALASNAADEEDDLTDITTDNATTNTEEKVYEESETVDSNEDSDVEPTKQPRPLKKKARKGFGSELLGVFKSWGPPPRTPNSSTSTITNSSASSSTDMQFLTLTDVSLVDMSKIINIHTLIINT